MSGWGEYRRPRARTTLGQARRTAERQRRHVILLRAPVAGHVLRVPERSAWIVAAGTPVIEIGDARSLEVVTDVLSSDAVRIRPGAEVMIVDRGGRDRIRRMDGAIARRYS